MYGFLLVFYSYFVARMNHFWDIRLVSIQRPWKLGYGSLKVIRTDTDRSAIYDFLLMFHSNHGPILYCFWDKQQFRSKIAKCSHPLVFCTLAEVVLLRIGYQHSGQKTGMMKLLGRAISLTISSAVWIQCTNVTDRLMDTERQQRLHLRIASCGKSVNIRLLAQL